MQHTPRSRAGILNWLRPLWILPVLWLLGAPAGAQGGRPDPEGTPSLVEVSVLLLDLQEIDSSQQNFTANLFLLMSWQDARLAHPGPAPLRQELDAVWNPRLQIVNQEKLWKTFPEEVEISPEGQVTYRQRYYGTFSQRLNLADFPFDRHRFLINLVTVGYGPDEVLLVRNEERPSGLGPDISLPDWGITGWELESTSYQPLPGLRGVSSCVFSIDAERHVGYYFFKVLLPLILVLAMSWIVFWIDPTQLGTQISVSVTSMLTLIAYRFMISGLLPKISYLTRLDVIILGATLLVFATLAEAVITSSMALRGKLEAAQAIDRKSRVIFPLAFVVLAAVAILH